VSLLRCLLPSRFAAHEHASGPVVLALIGTALDSERAGAGPGSSLVAVALPSVALDADQVAARRVAPKHLVFPVPAAASR
jgi:hypothetical protein